MFCIKCGKEALKGNFCKNCFLETNSLFEIGGGILYLCEMCNSYHVKKSKTDVESFITSLVKTKNVLKSVKISRKEIGNRIIADVVCSGYISGIHKTERKRTTVIVKRHKCEDCIKISGNYHEAVIQARGENSERILKKVSSMAEPQIIANISRASTGYDIKITSKRKASKIIQVLMNKFDVNASYKLVGEKKGIKLYRNYYAVR